MSRLYGIILASLVVLWNSGETLASTVSAAELLVAGCSNSSIGPETACHLGGGARLRAGALTPLPQHVLFLGAELATPFPDSDNVTAENGTATKFATELDLAGLSRVFVVPAGGSVTLQRLRLTGAALPAAPYPLPPASFLALSAFQLPAAPQPAPPLTLVDVEVVTPSCVALSLHQDFACRAAPSPNFTVSPGSLTVHRLVTASISLTNVRLSCSGAVPAPWPCLAAVVNSASQFLRSVASMTHTVADTPDTISQQFRPYLYVWLNSSMALADGLPDPGAVLRGFAIPLTTLRLSVAGPPDGATTLDLAGTGGLFPIDLYGSRIANVELANLTLRNPPPGPPEYGLFNLLRLLIWTFSFNRRIFTQKDFGPVLTLTNVRVEGVPREEVAMYAADAGPPLITYLSATGAAVPAAAANASVSGDVGSQAGASTTWPAAAALVPCLCAVDTGVFTSINASQVADPRDAIHIRTAGSLSKLTFYWNVTVALSAQPLPAPAGIGITAATAPDECPFGTDSFCNLEPMLSVSAGRSAHKWPFLYRAGTPANPYVVTAGSLQARSRSTESSKNTIPAVMVTSPVAAYTFDPDTDVVTYTRIERPYTLYGSASMRVMVDWRGVRALVRLQQSAGSSAGGSRRAGNGSSSGTGAGAAGVAGAVSGAAVSSRNASLTVRFLTMVGLAAATEPSPAPATLGSSNSSVASGGSSTTNQQQPAPGRRRRGRGLQQQQAGGSSRTSRMLLQLAAAAGNASSTSGGGSAEPTQGLPAAMGNFTSCVWAIRFDRAAAVEMAAVGSGGASSSSGGGGGGGALGDDLPYVFLDGVTLVVPAPELQLLAWALTERPEAVAAAVPDAGLAAQLAALAAGSALALRDAGSGGGNTSSNGHTGSSSDNSNNGSVDGVSSLELSRFRWCGLLGRNVTLTSRVPTPDDFAALSVEELAIMSGLTLPAALELSVQASSSSSSNTSAGASPIGNGTANGIDGVGGGGSNGSPSGAPAGPSPAPALLPPPPPRHWAVPPSPATTAGSRGNTPSGAPHPPLPAAGSSSTTTHTGAGTGAGGGAEATTGISRPEDGSGASSQARGIAIGAAVGCVALVSVVLLLVLYLFAVRRWRLREPVAWSSDKAISRADDGGCRSGCLDVWMPPAAAKGATGAEAAASGDGSGGCSTSSKYRRSAEGTRSTPSSFGCPAPIAGGDGAVAAGGGSGPAGAPGVSSASSLAVAMVELAQEPAAAEAAVAAAAQQPGAGEAAAALVLPSPSRSMVSLLRTMVSSPLSVSVSRLGRAAPAAPALGTAPRATTPPLSLSQSPPQLPPLRLARHHGGQQSPLAHTSRGGQSVTPRGFAALLATAPRGSLLPPSPAAPEPGSAQHSPTAAAAAAGSPTSRMAVATGSFRRLRTASVTSTAPSNTIQRALAEMYGSLHQTRLGVSAVHQHMEPHGTEASGGSWSQQQYRSTDFPSAGPGSPRVVLQAAAGSKLLAAAAAAVVGAAAHGDGRPSSMPQWGFLLREPVAQAQAQAAWLPARGGRLRPISAAAAAVWCGDVAATTAAGGRTAAAPHHQAHDVGGGAHRGLRQGRLLAACTDAAGGAAAAAGGCSGTEPGLSADLGAGDDGSADHTSSANGAQWAKHAAAAGVPLGSTAGPGARCAPAGATGAAGHGTSAGQKPPQPSHATAWGLSAAIGADATAAAGAGGSSTSGSGGGGSQGTPRSTSSVVAGATLASTGGASPRTGWGADASSAEPHLLTLTGELGRGAQGVVYRGLWRGLDVAVKSTLLQRAKGAAGGGGGGGVAADSDPRIRQAILEAAISASVSHPNVVATYTYMLQQLGEEPGEGGASSTSRSGSSGAADSVGGGSRGGVEVWKLTLVQELCDANSLRRCLEQGLVSSWKVQSNSRGLHHQQQLTWQPAVSSSSVPSGAAVGLGPVAWGVAEERPPAQPGHASPAGSRSPTAAPAAALAAAPAAAPAATPAAAPAAATAASGPGSSAFLWSPGLFLLPAAGKSAATSGQVASDPKVSSGGGCSGDAVDGSGCSGGSTAAAAQSAEPAGPQRQQQREAALSRNDPPTAAAGSGSPFLWSPGLFLLPPSPPVASKPGSAGRNSSNSGVGPEGSHGRSGDKSGSSSNSRLHRGSAVAASSGAVTASPSAAARSRSCADETSSSQLAPSAALTACALRSERPSLPDTRTQQPSAARPPLRDVVLCLALHIARGLEHLHSRGIVHGDVSSSNVLLQREGRGKAAGAVAAVVSTGGGGGSSAHTPLSCGFVAKVCDFGLSGRLDASEEQTHLSGPARRSSAYSAPELVRHGRSSPAGDVYAFAVVAWELAWGASLPTLLARPDGARMVAWLASQAMAPPADVTALPLGLLTWPPATPLELLALVGDCLREQAAARPSMHAVCQVLHGMT